MMRDPLIEEDTAQSVEPQADEWATLDFHYALQEISMCTILPEDFKVHIQLVIAALKTCDKRLLKYFEEIFTSLISRRYYIKVLSIALHKLATTDPDIYDWSLTNLNDFTKGPKERSAVLDRE